MNFKTLKFKDIIEYKSGYTWSKEQETKLLEKNTVRVLTVTNVQEKLDLSSKLYLKNVTEKDKCEKAVSQDWCIAVSSNGNRKRIGNAVFISNNTDYLFASFLTAFKPKENADILPKYFYYLLSSHEIQGRITSVSEGTTGLGNLDIRYLRNMELSFPDNLSEQHAFASILSKLDDAIEATENSIKGAEKLKKSLMQNLLTGKLKPNGTRRTDEEFYIDEKFGKVPKGWETGKLGDIADILAGQSPPGDTYNDEGKGLPMLNGPTEFTDLYPIPVQFTTKPIKVCDVDDILFTVRGSSTGRMNIADQVYCIGRGIAAIRENGNSDIDFIYYTLIKIADKILAEAKGAGSTFPNVNRGELLKKKIIYPKSCSQQKAIAKIIEDVELLMIQKHSKIQTLKTLKKSLMQNLLTGKVRVDVAKINSLLREA